MAGKEPEATDGMRSFGATLRAFRRQAGLSQLALSTNIGYSEQQVSSVERGRRFASRDLAEQADEVLEANGILIESYKPLQQRKGLAPRFQGWSEIEDEAKVLYCYECRMIPGLLQPQGYARAVFASGLPPLTAEQIDAQWAARKERHRLLHEQPNTEFSFVIEQSVLARRLGGPDVCEELAEHLLEVSALPNVEVLFLEQHQSEHAALDGTMYLA